MSRKAFVRLIVKASWSSGIRLTTNLVLGFQRHNIGDGVNDASGLLCFDPTKDTVANVSRQDTEQWHYTGDS